MEKITSIKVNDAEPYTKVDNKFLMKEDTFRAYVNMVNITIGNKEFTKDTNKVVISAEGYKDLVLEVGKDYKSCHPHKTHRRNSYLYEESSLRFLWRRIRRVRIS